MTAPQEPEQETPALFVHAGVAAAGAIAGPEPDQGDEQHGVD